MKFSVKCIIIFYIFLISICLGQGIDVQVNTDPPGRPQNTTSIIINPSLPGNIVVAYEDDFWNLMNMGIGIGIGYSFNFGATWNSTFIPSVWLLEQDPSVTVDAQGRLFAGMASYNAYFNGNTGIYVASSPDGGATWTPSTPVYLQSFTGTNVPYQTKPKVVADSWSGSPFTNNVYVVWEEDNPNGINGQVRFSVSADGGATFSATPLVVNDLPFTSSLALWPSMDVAPNGNVFVSWLDAPWWTQSWRPIYVDVSNNGGATFGTDVVAANFWTIPQNSLTAIAFFNISYPAISVDPGNSNKVYIAYAGDPDAGGILEQRIDTGDAAGANLSFWGTSGDVENRRAQNICCAGLNCYVAYVDYRSGNPDIYFNCTNDGGRTWQNQDICLNSGTAGQNTVGLISLCNSGNNVYAAWENIQSGTGDLRFKRSTNNGQAWGTIVKLNGRNWLSMCCTGSNVYLVGIVGGTTQGVCFNYSTDYGQTWQATDIIVDAGPTFRRPDIAGSVNDVYLTYEKCDPTGTKTDIFFKASNNNGITWSPTAIRINTGVAVGSNLSTEPIICCSQAGQITVAYIDRRHNTEHIYVNNSQDGGQTWLQNAINLNSGVTPGSCNNSFPQIANNGNLVAVVYQSDRRSPGALFDIFCVYSLDGGATWSGEMKVNLGGTGSTYSACAPSVACLPNQIGIAWSDTRNGKNDIYYNFLSQVAGGFVLNNTDARVDVGDAPGANHSSAPRVVSSTAETFIAWPDGRNGSDDIYVAPFYGPDGGDIFCIASTDGGNIWSAPVRVNDDNTITDQVQPWIDVKPSGIVDIAWYDARNANNTTLDVYMAASYDGGLTFSRNIPVTDQPIMPIGGTGMGYYTALTVDTINAYLAWTDPRTDAGGDIYFDVVPNPPDTHIKREKKENHPNAFELSQNYPNPFNSSTKISYFFKKSSWVRLKVYDLLGKEVKTLVNAYQYRGAYSIEFDTSDLTSGVYYYQLKIGDDFSETKKMLLIR